MCDSWKLLIELRRSVLQGSGPDLWEIFNLPLVASDDRGIAGLRNPSGKR